MVVYGERRNTSISIVLYVRTYDCSHVIAFDINLVDRLVKMYTLLPRRTLPYIEIVVCHSYDKVTPKRHCTFRRHTINFVIAPFN